MRQPHRSIALGGFHPYSKWMKAISMRMTATGRTGDVTCKYITDTERQPSSKLQETTEVGPGGNTGRVQAGTVESEVGAGEAQRQPLRPALTQFLLST